jgi:hypothetical protein
MFEPLINPLFLVPKFYLGMPLCFAPQSGTQSVFEWIPKLRLGTRKIEMMEL